jgi:hypothetical protein
MSPSYVSHLALSYCQIFTMAPETPPQTFSLKTALLFPDKKLKPCYVHDKFAFISQAGFDTERSGGGGGCARLSISNQRCFTMFDLQSRVPSPQ